MKKTIKILFSLSPLLSFLAFIIFEINPFRKALLTLDCLIGINNNISNTTISTILGTIIILGSITGLIIIPLLKKYYF